MGATFSYLDYASQPRPHSHEHVSQQLHPSSLAGLTLILDNGDAMSPSIIDLHTRLAALEKDLQISRSENTDKEAVIQYLLRASVNNAQVKEITVKLKEQLRDLKTTNDQTEKENKEIKAQLRRAEDTIFALSTPTVPGSRLQSITSFASRSGLQSKSELVTGDLIDLLGSSQESESAKRVEEDTTLLDAFYEEDSEIEGLFKNTTPDQSLQHSFESETKESSYIIRFANSDENATPQDTIRVPTEVQVPRSLSGSVAPLAASLNQQGPGGLQHPNLFNYGINFNPADSDRDVYRTIVVSNISPAISLGALLNHVRGGLVIDAKLLDTVKITGSKSALITFLHEHAAMAFEYHASKNPIMIGGIPAQVRVVSTPTWPIRNPLRKAIFDHHYTRCLKVYNFPWRQIPAHRLRSDLAVCREMAFDRITHMQKGTDGILELQFSSVHWASHAHGMLSNFSVYRNCTPCFAADPCAQLLVESLDGQHVACTAETGAVAKDSAAPGPESATAVQRGRLSKVEWESDPERCCGRGFAMES